MKKIFLLNTLAAVLAAGVGTCAHAAGNFSLTSGFDYSTGKYGGSTSTDILYIPIIGKYSTGPWMFQLTVPYVRITGPGNVVRDLGVLRQTTTTTRTTESGLGDVVAAATYNLYAGTTDATIVDLTGKVKFGTADETKGLGTGKNDYALQVDGYKGFGAFTAFGSVGYKVLGSPAGYSLNNVFYGSLGGAYKFDERNSGGVIIDLRQKASTSGSPQRDLTAYISHKIDETWKAQAYVVKGFADGSPDWGLGAMVSYAF